MCLTIPKKVIAVDGEKVTVESLSKKKQEVGTIEKVRVGDFVLTQQNIIIQKISKGQAEELTSLINNYAAKK